MIDETSEHDAAGTHETHDHDSANATTTTTATPAHAPGPGPGGTSPGRVEARRRIGILGGTGPAGRGLAARLAACGHEVSIGSRDADRARQVAATVVDSHPGRALRIEGCDNRDAAGLDVVIVATPWDAAVPTVNDLADRLQERAGERLVVSMVNALAKRGDEFVALVPPRGSVAMGVQAAIPYARVSAAFHHLPARDLAALDEPMDADVLVCADRPGARDETLELVSTIPGLRGLGAGSLANAGPVEAFTAVLLTLNLRHRTRTSVRIDGLRTSDGHTVPGTV